MDAQTTEHVLSQVGRLLDAEVIFQNRKCGMGLDEFKARLAHLPGIRQLTARSGSGGTEIYALGDTTIEIHAGTSHRQDRERALAKLLSTTPEEIARAYAAISHTTQPPDLPWQPERTKMSITGLKSGKFQAMLAEMRREIEETQNQGVADVMAAKDQAAAEIKTTIAGVKDKIKSEVSDALQEFSEFTNGGPA